MIASKVLLIVLSVFVSNVYPNVFYDPVIQIYTPQGFSLEVHGHLTDISIDLSVFLITDNGDVPIIQSESFHMKSRLRWYYENHTTLLMPGQKIRFMFYIYDGKGSRSKLFFVYKVPLWPGNAADDTQTCQKSKTTVQGRDVCAGELIFEDNFDLLSKPVWTNEHRIPLDTDDADFVMYLDGRSYIYTQNSNVHFRPTITDEVFVSENKVRIGQVNLGENCTGIVHRERECKRQGQLFRIVPPIISGRINTRESFSFRYGKIEVRAKLPKGNWLFPLITLEPSSSEYGVSGYSSGQMRVAFIRSNEDLWTKNGHAIDGSYLFGGVVVNTGETDRETWLRSIHGTEHWGDKFHNYTLTWTNTSISLAYDGNTYATISGRFNRYMSSPMSPFDKEFYISIGVSAGGISDFPDGSVSGTHQKPWNNTDPKGELKFYNAREIWRTTWGEGKHHLLIDHIKVWAL